MSETTLVFQARGVGVSTTSQLGKSTELLHRNFVIRNAGTQDGEVVALDIAGDAWGVVRELPSYIRMEVLFSTLPEKGLAAVLSPASRSTAKSATKPALTLAPLGVHDPLCLHVQRVQVIGWQCDFKGSPEIPIRGTKTKITFAHGVAYMPGVVLLPSCAEGPVSRGEPFELMCTIRCFSWTP